MLIIRKNGRRGGQRGSPALTSIIKRLVKTTNDFSQRIYKSTHDEKPKVGNLVVSGFSVSLGLAMLTQGSELGLKLGFNEWLQGSTVRNGAYRCLLSQLNNNFNLKVANKIFVMQGFRLKKAFSNVLRKYFFSDVGEINFAESERAVEEIHRWVGEATNERIEKNLFQPSMLDSDTRLVLVNTIYFKAEWKFPFDKSSTTCRTFYDTLHFSSNVQMMQQKNYFKVRLNNCCHRSVAGKSFSLSYFLLALQAIMNFRIQNQQMANYIITITRSKMDLFLLNRSLPN